MRRRKSNKSKSSKSKSGKKGSKKNKSKSSKSSKSKGSKSSKKKGNKKDKSCKSSKSGKSAKKCDDRDGDFTEIIVTAELSTLLRRKLQTSDLDVEVGFGTCLNPPGSPFVVDVECSGGPDTFFCEADFLGIPIDEAADIVNDLFASFNDGSLNACISTELPGFGVTSFDVEVNTDAPTATPTEAPVEPTEAPVDPTEAPVAPVAPSVPTLAPSASAYPTAADPVPGPGDDD